MTIWNKNHWNPESLKIHSWKLNFHFLWKLFLIRRFMKDSRNIIKHAKFSFPDIILIRFQFHLRFLCHANEIKCRSNKLAMQEISDPIAKILTYFFDIIIAKDFKILLLKRFNSGKYVFTRKRAQICEKIPAFYFWVIKWKIGATFYTIYNRNKKSIRVKGLKVIFIQSL